MNRISTLIAAALLLAATAAHGADYQIGFVNTERLFREAAPAKRAQQKLEKEFAARDADLQKLTKQVRDLQTLLDKDGPTMGESERRNKERDLANPVSYTHLDLYKRQRFIRMKKLHLTCLSWITAICKPEVVCWANCKMKWMKGHFWISLKKHLNFLLYVIQFLPENL